MRTLLLLSAVATLAACDDSQSATAPINASPIAKPSAQLAVDAGPSALAAKGQGGGPTVTVVTSNEFSNAGGGVAGSIGCPAGTTVIGGGYAFVTEGNWDALPTVTQNQPNGNGWWVRTVNAATGHLPATFKVYAICAS